MFGEGNGDRFFQNGIIKPREGVNKDAHRDTTADGPCLIQRLVQPDSPQGLPVNGFEDEGSTGIEKWGTGHKALKNDNVLSRN